MMEEAKPERKSKSWRNTSAVLSLLVTAPIVVTGCGQEWVAQDAYAYDECLLEEIEANIDLDCDDDDSDWYKMKGYKSKKSKTKLYKSYSGPSSSKSGFGGGYSSGG